MVEEKKSSRDPENSDLVEITEARHVEEVKENLNLSYKEMDEIAPLIVGTVVH